MYEKQHTQNKASNRAGLFLRGRRVAFLTIVAAMFFGFVVISFTGTKNQWSAFAQALGNSPTSQAAIEQFWAIYHGNNYAAIPQVQEQLQAAIALDPNNPTLYALLGATHFWHVGESARDPNPQQDEAIFAQDMPTAAGLFEKALNLDYYTPHVIGYVNDDHLPGYWGITTVHTGQQQYNPNLITYGDSILDFAAYEFPEFNNFNRWAAYNTEAWNSDNYQKGLDGLWQGLDACAAAKIDRENPDLKPYLNLATGVGRKKTCWWEGDIAPYAYEGFMLNLGNGLVKAGKVEAAKIMYANARYAANYSTWPYRAVLEAIAASDLNARVALYKDNDPSNDPPLSVPNRGCVYCHATVPEPGIH